MSRRTPLILIATVFTALMLFATAFAQTPPRQPGGTESGVPGTPGGGNGGPGDYGTPPVQAFEEFTIRTEPELGSPRCPETQEDADHCKAAGWLSTRSQNFVNITGEAFLRGSSVVPQGVQMTSSFVASQDDTNVAIQFSAEAFVEDDVAKSYRRLFVRALVDGQPVAPSDVVFATTSHVGAQAFIFTTNVDAGIHTVEMQWKVDSDATAYMKDASLMVRMGTDEKSEKGTFTVKTAPSGLNQEYKKQAWGDVPGMSASVYVPAQGQVTASFSAENFTSNGKRMQLRAVIDGAPMQPGDVVFSNNSHPSSQAMTFGTTGIAAGWHTVKIQWYAEAGGTVGVGDRSLAVSALPTRTEIVSHKFVAAPSGDSVYTPKEDEGFVPLKDMTIDFEVGPNGNGEVAVQFSAETDALDSGHSFAALAIDGAILNDTRVLLTDGSQATQVKSFVLEAKGLTPGKHTAEIWFASGPGGQAVIGDRSMNLMSETGFIPDLAEAPVFGGGHINMDSDRIAGIEPLIGSRKVLAILIDPHLCEGTNNQNGQGCNNQYTVPKGKVDAAIFGTSAEPGYGAFQPNNIASYLEANSGDRFTIVRGGPGIAGWYNASEPAKAYYQHDGSCTAGFDEGGLMLIADAVMQSDGAVDYADFDTDGNGELSMQELAIFVIIPQPDGDGSSIQPLYASTCPGYSRMELDGVELPKNVAKWNTSLNDAIEEYQFMTGAHELLHLIGGLDDLYTGEVSTYPGDMTVMADNRGNTTHLDAFQKLAFGWATPVIVDDNKQITVAPIAKSNVVYVLPRYNNPWEEEFFVLENRIEGMGAAYFDEDIADEGIAVWHIVSDRTVNIDAPIGTTQAAWDAAHIPADKPESKGQMGRNGIRLIRPFDDIVDGNATFWNFERLWDKGDYSLESGDCLLVVATGDPFHNRLPWADCEASGYNLKFLDFAIENAKIDVTVN